ncbi:MAG: response regulator transcription factor [Planctomycetota bacterium]
MARVLIVDDDEDFTVAATEMLRLVDHEVAVEPRADAALARMRAQRPDLVILDVMFPQGSSAGFELARTMREDVALHRVPILMLTAVGQKFPFGFGPSDVGDEALPVDDFVEKPVEPGVLREKVSTLLGQAGGGDAAEEGRS